MATSPIPFIPAPLRSSPAAAGGHRKPDQATSGGSRKSWWTPIFGWSSDPDYIDDPTRSEATRPSQPDRRSSSSLDPRPARSRIAPGGFTEEKARQLRKMTLDTASFHDAMYHSAIASRLASDFGTGPDL